MTHAKSTRILLPALLIATLIITASARPSEAGSFGLSLNIGNASINLGIGEPSMPAAPVVVAEPAPAPYAGIAPEPPAPRPARIAPPAHVPGGPRAAAPAPRQNIAPPQAKAPNAPNVKTTPQVAQRANPGQQAPQQTIVRGAAPTQQQRVTQHRAPGGPRR